MIGSGRVRLAQNGFDAMRSPLAVVQSVVGVTLLLVGGASCANAGGGMPSQIEGECPCDRVWKTRGDYLSCVARAASRVSGTRPNAEVVSGATGTGCEVGDPGSSAVKVVGPEGGGVSLAGIADVTFPPDAFPEQTTVVVETTGDEMTADAFTHSTGILLAQERAPFEVRILSEVLPRHTSRVCVRATKEILSGPPDSTIEVFAQVYQENDLELLDVFELFSSNREGDDIFCADLPDSVFTEQRRADGMAEAIIVLARTSGEGEEGE